MIGKKTYDKLEIAKNTYHFIFIQHILTCCQEEAIATYSIIMCFAFVEHKSKVNLQLHWLCLYSYRVVSNVLHILH